MKNRELAEKIIQDQKSPFDADTGKIKNLKEWLN